MNEECERLQADIDELQSQIMQASKNACVKAPNPKELKDFSVKLQVTSCLDICLGRIAS